MRFPTCSIQILHRTTLNIIEIRDDVEGPMFNLMLWVERLANIGVVFGFGRQVIILDDILNPTEKYKAVKDTLMLYQIVGEKSMLLTPKLKSISIFEDIERVVKILDAKYENSDLPDIVNNICSHQNSFQRSKPPALLQKSEELFDGTLRYFQIDPVKFHPQLGATPYNSRSSPVPHKWMVIFRK